MKIPVTSTAAALVFMDSAPSSLASSGKDLILFVKSWSHFVYSDSLREASPETDSVGPVLRLGSTSRLVYLMEFTSRAPPSLCALRIDQLLYCPSRTSSSEDVVRYMQQLEDDGMLIGQLFNSLTYKMSLPSYIQPWEAVPSSARYSRLVSLDISVDCRLYAILEESWGRIGHTLTELKIRLGELVYICIYSIHGSLTLPQLIPARKSMDDCPFADCVTCLV